MIIIAHRGNLNGSKPELENKPEYIEAALKAGFDVEVDVWAEDGKLFLGHDGPEVETTISFLYNDRIWCHAKNAKALEVLLLYDIHCFFIQEDDLTLTSGGIPYGYTGRGQLPEDSIAIAIGVEKLQDGLLGVCTDYPIAYK